MKNLLFLIFFASFSLFAEGKLVTINSGLSLYSEYYPYPQAPFKGTIIFENGSGTDLMEWKANPKFFDCVKQLGSLFLYDRSGLGKSPPDFKLSAEHPITSKLVTDKLLALLQQRDVKPPYLLVAHSYGAMYAGYFALKHPQLIKGLILIDPVPREFHFAKATIQKLQSRMDAAKTHSAAYIYNKYSGSKAEVIYQLLGFEDSKNSIKQLGPISNNIPVIIISSSAMEKDKPLDEDWYLSQKQWLNNNPNSKILQIKASHFVQLDRPGLVCRYIKKLLATDVFLSSRKAP